MMGVAAAAPNWKVGAAATTGAAVCPAFEPAVKLKLGVECAENENGLWPPLASLLLLLLLLPEPNWKGVAAGWLLLFTAELAPNSNIFLDCGSSFEAVVTAAAPPPPNGLTPLAAIPPKPEGAAPKAGAEDWPKIDGVAAAGPEDVGPLPKLLEPNVGVALLATAPPKLPNVLLVVPDVAAGLPNMGLAAVAAGDPNTGPLLVWVAGVGAGLAAAPKLNAGVADCSAGLDAPPVKLNADEAPPLAAPAAPKIDVVLDDPVVAAPNEPNVAGLSAAAVVAVEPKLGITLEPAAG